LDAYLDKPGCESGADAAVKAMIWNASWRVQPAQAAERWAATRQPATFSCWLRLARTICTNSAGKLSGGESRLGRSGCCFPSGPDILLLDEPTNHLDVEAGFLKDFSVGAVCPRPLFLDRVVTSIAGNRKQQINHAAFTSRRKRRYELLFTGATAQEIKRLEEFLKVGTSKR